MPTGSVEVPVLLLMENFPDTVQMLIPGLVLWNREPQQEQKRREEARAALRTGAAL